SLTSVKVSPTVVIPAGDRTAKFSFSTSYVGSTSTGQITASVADTSVSAQLSLLPLSLADSPWPKFHGNNKNTGQGMGSGADGTELWSYGIEEDDDIQSSPVIGLDGTIYYVDYHGYLVALNSDATLKWIFLLTDSSFVSTPSIAADGTIYCGDGVG